MILVDKDNKLSQEQKLTLILWSRKIDISQVAKNILQGGMVDGEGLIKPVERWDKDIGKYIKPVFLEIGAKGYGLKKEFNDDMKCSYICIRCLRMLLMVILKSSITL